MDQNNNENMNQGQEVPQGENQNIGVGAQPVETPTNEAKSDTVSEFKLYGILGYVLPFLFFLPLLNEPSKSNAFARFHANQQLVLLISWVGLEIVLNNFLYSIIGTGVYMLMSLVHLALLVLVIMGIIAVVQGEMKELPLIGTLKILK